jgi:adenylylsulfate kinase-like enzyme
MIEIGDGSARRSRKQAGRQDEGRSRSTRRVEEEFPKACTVECITTISPLYLNRKSSRIVKIESKNRVYPHTLKRTERRDIDGNASARDVREQLARLR